MTPLCDDDDDGDGGGGGSGGGGGDDDDNSPNLASTCCVQGTLFYIYCHMQSTPIPHRVSILLFCF